MNNKGGNLSVIIVASHRECGQNNTTYSGQKTIIETQIENTRSYFPKSEIVCVLGDNADKTIPLMSGVKIVENENFAQTSQYRSAVMGLRSASNENALIVFGNCFFSGKALLEQIHQKSPKVFTVEKDRVNNHLGTLKVTTQVQEQEFVHMNYDIDQKRKDDYRPKEWANVIQLDRNAIHQFMQNANDPVKRKFLVHEILNEMALEGSKMHCAHLQKGSITQYKKEARR